MNPAAIIEPYLERFLLGEKKQWSEVVVEASREMGLAALSLPGELQRLISRAMRGELEMRVKNLEDNARLLYYSGQQMLWGMMTAAAVGLTALFDGRGQPRAAWASGIAAGVFGLFLVFTWLAGRPRRFRGRR